MLSTGHIKYISYIVIEKCSRLEHDEYFIPLTARSLIKEAYELVYRDGDKIEIYRAY